MSANLDRRLRRLAPGAALRAALTVGLGAAVVFGRPSTLEALLSIVGAYLFVDGMVVLWSSIERVGAGGGWLPLFLVGLLGASCGGAVVAAPLGIDTRWSLVLGWAIASGLLELLAEVRLRRVLRHDTFLAWSGVVTIALGVLMLRWPRGPGETEGLFLGYALVAGVFHLGLALRIRRASREHEPAIV